MKHILKCKKCGGYTLKEICPLCGSSAITIRPPKFSLEDKFGAYRRKAKFEILKKRDLV
jgi:H/ACA ribonucleoprotein complex subunit 3